VLRSGIGNWSFSNVCFRFQAANVSAVITAEVGIDTAVRRSQDEL
jgi:hypothetical protein